MLTPQRDHRDHGDHRDHDDAGDGMLLHLSARAQHRWLAPHLAEDERVELAVVGAHGSARSLLALTDRRVLLVADPRTGTGATAIPRVEMTAVEWARHGSTGSLTVRAGGLCVVLAHVRLDDGVRALPVLDDAAGTSGRRSAR